ncbi:MAG TPA: hypothetical protein PKE27_04270 [Povalibacter sp.]|uniref:hypothetical protein n=1 Tax=Povalibacter sp. TaxID=1962978 RepID=UPI002BE6DA1F|nr:hypothetical protein [Povalibacter sp.]HMN43759.1 hypothetical protein [Povalibacter sp.]
MRIPLLRFGLGSLLAMMAIPVVVANGGGAGVIDPVADADKLAARPNINQTPVGTSGKWTMEKLNALTQEEGIALWRTLPAPTLEEMNGHYTGLGPGADDPAYQKGYADYMFNEKSVRGYWLGKAFHPLTASTGEGYNRWRFPGGRIERNLRMATSVRPSIIDGKPAYVLDYGAFNKTTLFDELRKLEDGIYIGTATVARPDGTRSKLDMFILVGPTDEWVGAPYTLGPTPLKEGTKLPTK